MNGLAKMLAEQALRNDQYVLDQWYWIAMKKDQSSAHSAERGQGLVDEDSGLGEVKGGITLRFTSVGSTRYSKGQILKP